MREMNNLLKKCYLKDLDFDNGLLWNMDATIVSNGEQKTIPIITKDYLKDKIYRERFSYCFLSNKEDSTLDLNTRFQIFRLKNKTDIDRMASAFYADYNPIDNFDKIEESTENENASNVISGSVKETGTENSTSNASNVKSGKVTESGSDTQNPFENTTVNSVSPENNDTFYHKDKTINQIGQAQSTSNKDTTYNGLTDATQGNTENHSERAKTWENYNDTNTRSKTYNSRIHGNVGTTRTQTMIADELELRFRTLSDYIMDKFLDENTFYVSEMD